MVVVSEARIVRDGSGAYWSSSSFGYDFWRRYLTGFDEVVVACRVQEVERAPAGARPVEGPGVTVAPLPYYVGLPQYLRMRRRFDRAVAAVLADGAGSVVLRMPGNVGRVALRSLRARPFGVEVVGDPLTVFSDQRSLLLRAATSVATRSLRRACRAARCVAYVTSHGLPETYPPGPGTAVFAYSSVDLPPEAFAAPRHADLEAGSAAHLVAVGSMAQPYKGFDVLIDAVAIGTRSGRDLRLTIVGDGEHRAGLEALAQQRGVADRIAFVGEVATSSQVREFFDEADLFVSSSRTEGLPRAMIEAMARGLPCVGTEVGGTPELLPPSAMCPVDRPDALWELLDRHLRDRELRWQLQRSLREKAATYASGELQRRRTSMYTTLRAASGA